MNLKVKIILFVYDFGDDPDSKKAEELVKDLKFKCQNRADIEIFICQSDQIALDYLIKNSRTNFSEKNFFWGKKGVEISIEKINKLIN
ncbi:hypothetical protein FJ208_00040 [Candidatus Gribaldobacteria bacterium]|nr:hypothetical protein [Candidatus Gribaldobacteria bacterium]